MEELNWDEPFDLSIFQSQRRILVRCMSLDDADKLSAILYDAEMISDGTRKLMINCVQSGQNCFRFTRWGRFSGYSGQQLYDQDPDFAELPRFTFYNAATSLPDLDMSGSATLL